MARTRAANYEDQRDAILAQAISAFARDGYVSASMTELATACEISKAGLYHYYPSKDAILFDALNRFTSRLVQTANAIDDPLQAAQQTPQTKLHRLISRFMAIYRGARDDQIVLLNSVQFLSPKHRQIIVYQERQVVDAFAQALQACHPAKVNAQNRTALTMTLLSAINFSFAWLREDGALTHQQYADWVAKLWIDGLVASRFEIAAPHPLTEVSHDTN